MTLMILLRVSGHDKSCLKINHIVIECVTTSTTLIANKHYVCLIQSHETKSIWKYINDQNAPHVSIVDCKWIQNRIFEEIDYFLCA